MFIAVSGQRRAVPDALWGTLEGPKPPESFSCNGCTASPDYLPGTGEPIWPACVIHDYHYSPCCQPAVPKRDADATFRRNIRRVLAFYGVPLVRRVYLSTLYWAAVRLFGGRAYDARGASLVTSGT